MDKTTLNRLFGVTKLTLTADLIDRGLAASRRSLGSVSLDEPCIACMHPDCVRGEIRYTPKLRQTISDLKQKGEATGTFTIQCQGSKKGGQGRLTCGGFYQFSVEIEYESATP